jgi:hypothetical protein
MGNSQDKIEYPDIGSDLGLDSAGEIYAADKYDYEIGPGRMNVKLTQSSYDCF